MSSPRDFAEQLNIARGADSAADALAVRHNDRQYYGAGVQTVLGVPMTAGAAGHQFEIGVRYHEDEEDRFQREDDFAMINGRMVLTTLGAPASQANRVSHAEALATFVQDTIRWDKWSLTAGFRYENIDLTRTDYAETDPDRTSPARISQNAVDVLIPGFGVNFAMSPAIGLFGGVHKGFSPPGPGSAEDTGAGAEASVNYELGMRAQGHALNAEVVAFFNDYDNLLGRDTLAVGGTGEGDQFNGGEARVFGLEASASWNLEAVVPLRSSLPVQVAYTFTDAEFRNAFSSTFGPWGHVAVGDALPYIPTHQLYGSIGVDEPGWRVQLEGIYVDRMRTQAGQGPIGRAESTDSHLIFNVSGEYELAPGTSLFASMQNLTNRKYIVARRPAGARPGLPRLLLAGIKFDLGR